MSAGTFGEGPEWENCCGKMFWKGEFFVIFKIDHPNAESVEIHLEPPALDIFGGAQCQVLAQGFCLQWCHLPLP